MRSLEGTGPQSKSLIDILVLKMTHSKVAECDREHIGAVPLKMLSDRSLDHLRVQIDFRPISPETLRIVFHNETVS